MAKENNILEEAIIQMKNLEEAVAGNAKGILASTMKQEIKELVKESLNEADDDEEEIEDFEDSDIADVEFPEDEDEEDFSDEEDEDFEDEETLDFSDDEDDEVIDIRHLDDMGLSDEEKSDVLLKVFKAMKPTDEIQVEKDSAGNIHLSDNSTDNEYMIVGESIDDMDEMYDQMDEMYDMYEDENDPYSVDIEKTLDMFDEPLEETIYEVEMDEEMDEMYHSEDEEGMDDMYEMYHSEDEEGMDDMDDIMMESKKSFKAKGVDMGSASKFKYSKKPNMDGGFDEDMDEAPKSVGTGSAKTFKYGKGENLDGDFKIKPKKTSQPKTSMKMKPKRGEFKEASRTLGSGSNFRKGGLPKPKAHSAFNANIEESYSNEELNILREKNEEYRKALNVFRNKLNEVAVFNSNLAYATRLFTEHSTSKQEKINILKRFDDVDTLKESKTLYKIIKDELTSTKSQTVNESIERTINKVPTNGSAINLIESKTYENPQFMRMKDLMSKLK